MFADELSTGSNGSGELGIIWGDIRFGSSLATGLKYVASWLITGVKIPPYSRLNLEFENA